MKELILLTSLETKFYKSNSDYLNLTYVNHDNSLRKKRARFVQIGSLNYKFKRKSKNFYCWLEKVNNIYYAKTEGAICQ
jgi:hypothetical protein